MEKEVFKSTIFQIIGKLITVAISIVMLGILTKYLGKEYFGIYTKVFNYLAIFTFLADLGLYAITIKKISQNPEKTSEIASASLTLRIISGILIIFFATIFASFIPGYDDKLVLISVFIISIFSFISLINSSLQALMQSKLDMGMASFSNILGKVLNFILVLAVIFLIFPKGEEFTNGDFALILIFVSALIGVSLNTFLNFLKARKLAKLEFSKDKKLIKEIFFESLPYGIALFLGVVYFKVDVIMLSILEPKEIRDELIGIYSLPLKIIEVISVIGGFYLNSILPSLTENISKNKEKASKVITSSISLLTIFSFFTIIFGMLFSKEVILILGSSEFLSESLRFNSNDIFTIVLVVNFLAFLGLIFNYVLIASEKQSEILKINAFICLFNIIGNLIFIPQYSIMGSAIVTLASQALFAILSFYKARQIISIKFNFSIIFRGIISCILVFLGFLALDNFLEFGAFFKIIIFGSLLFPLFIIPLLNKEILGKVKNIFERI